MFRCIRTSLDRSRLTVATARVKVRLVVAAQCTIEREVLLK